MKIGHTESGRRSHSGPPMAEINIIPLVDITLVLLIIFMATTAFVNDAGLKMNLPAAQSGQATPAVDNDLRVVLTADNGLFLDGKATTLADMRAAFLARGAKNPDTRVIIKGDQSIPYKRVVEIMDLAKTSNLAKVVLGTQPNPEPNR